MYPQGDCGAKAGHAAPPATRGHYEQTGAETPARLSGGIVLNCAGLSRRSDHRQSPMGDPLGRAAGPGQMGHRPTVGPQAPNGGLCSPSGALVPPDAVEPCVAACAARPQEHRGLDAMISKPWETTVRIVALQQDMIEIAHRVAAVLPLTARRSSRSAWPKALSSRSWSGRSPGPNRTAGPGWACRSHTRDIGLLATTASSSLFGHVWPRVRLVASGTVDSAASGASRGRSR